MATLVSAGVKVPIRTARDDHGHRAHTERHKSSRARAAEEDGRSEADRIREGIERLLRERHPEARVPLFASGKP